MDGRTPRRHGDPIWRRNRRRALPSRNSTSGSSVKRTTRHCPARTRRAACLTQPRKHRRRRARVDEARRGASCRRAPFHVGRQRDQTERSPAGTSSAGVAAAPSSEPRSQRRRGQPSVIGAGVSVAIALLQRRLGRDAFAAERIDDRHAIERPGRHRSAASPGRIPLTSSSVTSMSASASASIGPPGARRVIRARYGPITPPDSTRGWVNVTVTPTYVPPPTDVPAAHDDSARPPAAAAARASG